MYQGPYLRALSSILARAPLPHPQVAHDYIYRTACGEACRLLENLAVRWQYITPLQCDKIFLSILMLFYWPRFCL
jgi:hypothetical protein